tara:strand:- start:1744 stop:1959 length:216 start_codon:yes stop_codon:yes gene_type:complete
MSNSSNAITVGFIFGFALAAPTFYGIAQYNFSKQPDNFDSMLCRVHTPTAAILVNDELITCTNGKKYRSTK